MIKDNILIISDWCYGQSWEIHFDLQAIAEAAGDEVKYSLTKARKMCYLVNKYITKEEAEQIDEIFKKNPKLYNIWRQYARF